MKRSQARGEAPNRLTKLSKSISLNKYREKHMNTTKQKGKDIHHPSTQTKSKRKNTQRNQSHRMTDHQKVHSPKRRNRGIRNPKYSLHFTFSSVQSTRTNSNTHKTRHFTYGGHLMLATTDRLKSSTENFTPPPGMTHAQKMGILAERPRKSWSDA